MILCLFFYIELNSATLKELYELPLDSTKIEAIYRYRELHGSFYSIYDLLKIKQFSPHDLKKIKGRAYVKRPYVSRENWWGIKNTEKKLAQEEGPGTMAVDYWEDVVVYPLDINKISAEELLRFYGVSITDANAILKYREENHIKGTRDLKWRIPDLSIYGYINIKNYVVFKEQTGYRFSGNFRYTFFSPLNGDLDVRGDIDDVLNSIDEWDIGSSEKTALKTKLEDLQDVLEQNRYFQGTRIKLRFNDRTNAGGAIYDFNTYKEYRFSSVIRNYSYIKNLVVGDYRISLNNGVLIDNAEDLIPRNYNKYSGIYGDLSKDNNFGFRGVALEVGKKNLSILGFYSYNSRNGYVDNDRIITYFSDPLKTGLYRDAFKEQVIGGFLKYGYFNTVSGITAGVLKIDYDKKFSPLKTDFDRPDDKYFFPDTIVFPVDWQNAYFVGLGGQSIIYGIETSMEAGYRINGGYGTLLKLRYQKPVWYTLLIIRAYSPDYKNPFNRGFTERMIYEDTPVEKSYRLIDPYLSYLDELPVPKPHYGVYFETRYQFSRTFTLKKLYVDLWKDYPYYLPSYRMQYQLQYRPVVPLSFETKYKVQRREKAGEFNDRYSLLNEFSFVMSTRVQYVYLRCEYMKITDEFLPNPKYVSSVIYGDMLKVSFEGEFIKDVSVDAGLYIFLSNGASLWSFEDVGIDFFEDQGSKWYFSLVYRPVWNMLLKFKIRDKRVMIPASNGDVSFVYNEYYPYVSFQMDIFFK